MGINFRFHGTLGLYRGQCYSLFRRLGRFDRRSDECPLDLVVARCVLAQTRSLSLVDTHVGFDTELDLARVCHRLYRDGNGGEFVVDP